ncbi:hypothetical protein BJ322DRAFT_540075 [Thelephora terrestris]|uniref:DUF6535 domain-containing protein n=1 Tax=Thelephora terrestris TaxID=56493 RepID=A0A9P6HLE0_9AGAM|nr:hypothetical protein BJ322DRAFT_540075 [Thelephora terrestris]
MNPLFSDEPGPQPQEPTVVQIDSKCLHSALKEFFEPLRTNDSRTDFFAVYRREAGEFDRDYANKYDEDLNTSLIFAGLFSAVSSAFIIDVQSNLQPDPNAMTAAYMQILIHTTNNSLFPDVDPSSVVWAGPPPEIVTVQSLLYASLATSLFAAFLAMLGKQWVNRYLRNHGGSAAEKSRDRQQKLDGFENWHFYLVIESLPVILQFALLLFGCALALYLWTISRTVAGVILAFTLFGVTSYIFFTLAATLHYHCPYQTPPSILARSAVGYLTHVGAALHPLLRPLIASLPSTKGLWRSFHRFFFGLRGALESFHRGSTVGETTEQIPLAVIVPSPTQIFEAIPIDWEVCVADARCISWVLDFSTDLEVISSTVQFAADTIWYPEIAGALSPHVLADLFFDCLLDGRVISSKLEYATSIGMALCSVLSIQLCVEPWNEGLRDLCKRICGEVASRPLFERTKFSLVVSTLRSVASTPYPTDRHTLLLVLYEMPEHLSITEKLWLSRVIIQILWRWRCVRDPDSIFSFEGVGFAKKRFMEGGDETPAILKTNFFLILSLYLGLQVNISDLFPPNNDYSLQTAIENFSRSLQTCIREGKATQDDLISVLATVSSLDSLQATQCGELGSLWINEILKSGYQERERYEMCGWVVRLLGNKFYPANPECEVIIKPTWIPPLLDFLSLNEKLCPATAPAGSLPPPGLIAVRILSDSSPPFADLCAVIYPQLTSALSLTHPQQLRDLALTVFQNFIPG